MNTNANVDAAEIARFEALASRWWDPQSEFKPLHDINPLRLDYIDQRADLSGKRVVDVGCGGGILAESMAARGAQVCGIDMGEAPLDVARLHALETGIELDWSDFVKWSLAILPRCDAVLFLGSSPGADLELQKATSLGIPVFNSVDEIPKGESADE